MSTSTQAKEAQKIGKKKRHKKSHRVVKSIRYFIGWRMLKLSFFIPHLIPLSWSLSVCKTIGNIAYYFPGGYRRRALANLKLVFGNSKPHSELNDVARKVGIEVTKGVFELVYSMSPRKRELYTSIMIEGREHLDAALRRGKGVIAISAHLGNFTIMEGKLISEGYPFYWVLKLPKDPVISDYLKTKMAQYNWKFIFAEPTIVSQKEIIRCLRRNEIVGLIVDEDQKAGGIPLKFMGQEIAMAPGPAILAKRTGATLLPMFIIRRDDNSHKIIIEPPIENFEDTSKDRSVILLTMKLARIIESFIHRYPTQWYWVNKVHRHTGYHTRLKRLTDLAIRSTKEGESRSPGRSFFSKEM